MALMMWMWDVEHGSAILIQTPNGKRLVIDLGASDQVSPILGMSKAGMKIDHVTITHPHMDHIDDILNFDLISPRTLLLPRLLSEDDVIGGNPKLGQEAEAKVRKYFEIKNRYNGDLTPSDDIKSPSNNGGVSIQMFVPFLSSSNLNNYSIVTTRRIQRGENPDTGGQRIPIVGGTPWSARLQKRGRGYSYSGGRSPREGVRVLSAFVRLLQPLHYAHFGWTICGHQRNESIHRRY